MATLINIAGTSRSGSTVLDLMLGNAPEAFSCGEVSAWFRPYRRHHFVVSCPCGQKPCPIWQKIKDVPEENFHAAVIKRLHVNFVVDSSKDLCWLIDTQEWAISHNINIHNLLIWKDPVSLAFSYWKRGFSINKWRHDFTKYHSNFFEIELPFLAINYCDLVSNPALKVSEICAAIGMPYFDGKERFWEKDHHHLFGSLSVRNQVIAKSSVIKSKENYPVEFRSNMNILENQIDKDSEVQQIMEHLRQSDISLVNNDKNRKHKIKKPYPTWYYRRRIIRIAQKYFPQRYDPEML